MEFANFEKTLSKKRIFITGHTGFTGSWVSLWLKLIGANIFGFAQDPVTKPSLFSELKLSQKMGSKIGDICDYEKLYNSVKKFQPDLILHLAAQPLVRKSYLEPLKTFSVNVQGTLHVLEIARRIKSVSGVLCITTDKVYKNEEWLWPYRENDALGGKDPYSGSKAAAEMIIHSYSNSFPHEEKKGPAIASARGGNIIGGGDWSEDRIIPDYVRSIKNKSILKLRYPNATRPWQHVLSLIHGYFLILAGLSQKNTAEYSRAWNLGPFDTKLYSVREVLETLEQIWLSPKIEYENNTFLEAQSLSLDSSLARNNLYWTAPWNTRRSLIETANWYKLFYSKSKSAEQITLDQINSYRQLIK